LDIYVKINLKNVNRSTYTNGGGLVKEGFHGYKLKNPFQDLRKGRGGIE